MDRPLQGKQILVLRTRSQAAAFIALIEAAGGQAYPFPVITIADPADWSPLDEAIRQIEGYQWLVITSPNGAERFVDRLLHLGRAVADLSHLKVAAVGPSTAEALSERGIQVDLLPKAFKGKAMPEVIAPYLRPGARVLMARGDLADKALAEGLTALGVRVDDLVAYRNLPFGDDPAELKRALAAGEIDWVAFTSSSTVKNLLEQIGGPALLGAVRIACIGPETAAMAERLGLPIHCTGEPHTLEGLLHAIIDDVQSTRGGH